VITDDKETPMTTNPFTRARVEQEHAQALAAVGGADRPHDFETEGRQDQRTVTPCAVCGRLRQASIHS
jgi:hypothetical protein